MRRNRVLAAALAVVLLGGGTSVALLHAASGTLPSGTSATSGTSGGAGAPTSGTSGGSGAQTSGTPGAPASGTSGGSGQPGSSAPTDSVPSRWIPPAGAVEWQWELDHPFDLASPSDMGTGAFTYTGERAGDPTVYDIDGFSNPAGTVRALHARGDRVICYVEVGAAETYRPDYRDFPVAALGNAMPGYGQERYLDITDAAVVRVVEARIAMCARKGFDAIEPDIDDSYTDDTGFDITEADNVAYDIDLADYAHSLGLSFGLKNGDDYPFAAQLVDHVDFALVEQCFQYATCSAYVPLFGAAHKAVLEVEYADEGGPPPSSFCPLANADGFDAMQLRSNLAGGRLPCR